MSVASPSPGRSKSVAPLLVAGLMWPVTHIVFQACSANLPADYGHLAAGAIYWTILAVAAAVFLRSGGLRSVWRRPTFDSTPDKATSAVCLAFALPAMVLAIGSSFGVLTTTGWALAISCALFNGTLEELFWRGVFLHRYAGDRLRGLILPTVFFTLWHLTLVATPGMANRGGPVTLVAGALVFGAIAGVVAFRQRSIVVPVISHVLLNIFAFSLLVVDHSP